MKTCKKCSTEKDIEDFYKNDNTCKECRKARVRENRRLKADHYKQYDRERYKNDPRVKDRHKKYQSTPEGQAALKRAKKQYIGKNPIKRAAHIMVGNAVRDGRVIKKYTCEQCGLKTEHIHGHHDDYAKPLEVRWLCPACHKEWHEINGEGLNAS